MPPVTNEILRTHGSVMTRTVPSVVGLFAVAASRHRRLVAQ